VAWALPKKTEAGHSPPWQGGLPRSGGAVRSIKSLRDRHHPGAGKRLACQTLFLVLVEEIEKLGCIRQVSLQMRATGNCRIHRFHSGGLRCLRQFL
jgi:hypothetical protein